MKKVRWIILGASVLALSLGSIAYGSDITGEVQTTETQSDDELLKSLLPARKADLERGQQETVEKIADVSKGSAGAAAELLKQIEDTDVFEAGVKEVLDGYYSKVKEDGIKEQIAEFSEAICERADEMLKNYREAQEEREQPALKLGYIVGEVLVTFQVGTTEEQIYRIMGYMGRGGRILSDFKIDENLPADKPERLEAVKDQEFPFVACMDIGLDKTVNRAAEILQRLSCVKYAGRNGIGYLCVVEPPRTPSPRKSGKSPTKLTVSQKKVILYAGDSKKLKIKSVKPARASRKVKWKSKNPKIVSVSKNGKIRAKKAGKTQVFAVSASNPKVKAKVKVVVRKGRR